MAAHAKEQGFGGIVLMIDEFLLWLAEKSGQEFVAEIKKIGTAQEVIDTAEKQGFDTGIRAIHPFDPNWKLPVYVANFVLMEYGTGAIFGCPAHDQRDLDFARRYDLPVIPVVLPEEEAANEAARAARVFEFDGFADHTGARRAAEAGDNGDAVILVDDDVADFIVHLLHRLTAETQLVLRLAACIGHKFDLGTLSTVAERSLDEVLAALWDALNEGMVQPIQSDGWFEQSAGVELRLVGGVDLLGLVAPAAQLEDLVVAHVLHELGRLGVPAEEMLADIN